MQTGLEAKARPGTRIGVLLRAATLVTGFSIISKLLGFGREAVLAAQFGAGQQTDAYLVATTIPAVLFGVFASLFSTVAIPVFTSYLHEDRERTDFGRLVWSSFHIMLCVTVVVAAFGWLFARQMVFAVAPLLSAETAQMSAHLTRIVMPATILVGLNEWVRAFLNAKERFASPAAVGLPYNIILIAAIMVGGGIKDVRWVAYGFVVALTSQLLVQVPDLLRTLPDYRLSVDLRHPGIRQIGKLLAPALLGAGASQINRIVDRAMASSLPIGSISTMNYANRLLGLPEGLLAVPVMTVLYPALAAKAASKDRSEFVMALNRGLTTLALVMVPTTLGLMVLRSDLIRVVYERGEFSSEDTQRTALVLLMFSMGLLFSVCRDYLARASYAVMDSWTPFWGGVLAVATNVALNTLLIRRWGLPALAFATSLGAAVGFFANLWMLRNRLGGIGGHRLLRECGKIAIASTGMIAFVLLLRPVMNHPWLVDACRRVMGTGSLGTLAEAGFRLGFLSLGGAAVYLWLCWIVRVEDFAMVAGVVRRFMPARLLRGIGAQSEKP